MGIKIFVQILISSLFFILLAGCWDGIELEDRAFLAGVAVDLAEEQGGKLRFELTNQFVVPAGLGSATEAGGGKAFRNLSQTGESLYEINARISKQANRTINTDHVEIVVVSQNVAKKTGLFADVLDVFIRQQTMRRGILIAIVDGKAGDVLHVETEHVKIPGQYISELLENKQTPETIIPVRIGDIQESLLNNRSFIIPQVATFTKNSVNYEGIAVFHGHTSQMVDTLNGDDAKGLNFIIGNGQEGSVTADVEEEQVTYIISNGSSKIKLKNRDKENMSFEVDMDITASIVEYFGTLDFYKKNNQEKFEKALEEKIKTLTEGTVEKVKDELQVDVLGLDNYLRMNHYSLWEEVKGDWDYGENYFSKSDIKVNVNTTVREPGNSIRVKKKGEEE
ncbi:Ger(x)C family spore germination protein [Ornithinibacillus salinisoli]|uniref:Ger(X)C family spore germination protein n=1 Tax=Ornithinibacillus salinisoli TaxID=1848459 RepID=A0ABW4W2E8_9BACI